MKTSPQKTNYWLFILIITIFIIADSACEHAESTYIPMLDVHGVIRNDCSNQTIVLSRSYNMNEKEYFDLENALVILAGGGLCDTMVNYSSNYFGSSNFFISPGTPYQIMIYADGYDTLYGKTATPGDFTIINPHPGDTVDLNDTIIFSASEEAREYQIAAINAWDHYDYWIIWPDAEPESLFKMPLALFSTVVSEGEYTLKVYACDSNYFDYKYYYGDDYPQCGVEGGIGLFGSAWVKSVPVYLKVN
jgi:hypothetical protein